MPIYDIAGLKVRISNISGRTEKQAIPYLADNQSDEQKIDIDISIAPERIEASVKEHPELNHDDWQYMLTGNDFYANAIKYNCIMLHSSCVVVDGIAYCFSADSGVGKSTHTQLWLKKFGSRAYILNDDKPCIRIIDGTAYACGTPFSGTDDVSVPKIIPLGGICFLERSESNWIKQADTKKAIFNILSQTLRKLGPNTMNKALDTIESIFNQVELYEFGCNISDEAVELSYNAMKRNNNE